MLLKLFVKKKLKNKKIPLANFWLLYATCLQVLQGTIKRDDGPEL